MENPGFAAGLGDLIQRTDGVFGVAGLFAGMLVPAVIVIVIDTPVTTGERNPRADIYFFPAPLTHSATSERQ
jgi:ABC-type nitrate/sulfonate/bicarbonate transport system permease component